jgi:peptidyl-tRNA hydrolase
VGIGRPQEGGDATAYVLSDFNPEERAVIEDTIAMVTEAVLYLLREGVVAAMNKYN